MQILHCAVGRLTILRPCHHHASWTLTQGLLLF